MRDAIVFAVLYVLALAFFRLLGGLPAAAETFRRWGNASSAVRTSAGSSG
jgi:hypothetical protein